MKKTFLAILGAASLFLLSSLGPSHAATCTWAGAGGDWDNTNTASWSCGAVPGPADSVVLTPSSGTIRVCGASAATCPNGNGVVTVQSITCGAMNGTLDMATTPATYTLTTNTAFNCSGTGTRTINCGTSSYNLSYAVGAATLWNFATATNATINCGAATITYSATNSSSVRTFQGGGASYGSLVVPASTGFGGITIGGANTFGSLSVGGCNFITFPSSVTTTITNAFTLTGSSSCPIFLSGNVSTISTPSGAATGTWVGLRSVAFTGGATFTFTNSMDYGLNSGASISSPSGGGGGSGGKIIGG